MTQNLTSLDLAEELPQLDAALDTIDRILKAFVSLDADQMRRLSKLGDKTESFCRQTAAILDQNRQALPPGFDLDELKRDFAAFDLLRPRLNRIEALADVAASLGIDDPAAIASAVSVSASRAAAARIGWLDTDCASASGCASFV